MERTRRDRNRTDEEALIQRMKNESNQALDRQWKIAQQQLTLVENILLLIFSNV